MATAVDGTLSTLNILNVISVAQMSTVHIVSSNITFYFNNTRHVQGKSLETFLSKSIRHVAHCILMSAVYTEKNIKHKISILIKWNIVKHN